MMRTLFTAEAISKGGRSGTIQTPAGLLDVTLGNLPAINGAPPESREVRFEIIQVSGKRLLRRIPLELGSDEAGALALLLSDAVVAFRPVKSLWCGKVDYIV